MKKKKAHREDLFVGPRISKNKRKSTEKNERHRQFGDALFFACKGRTGPETGSENRDGKLRKKK